MAVKIKINNQSIQNKISVATKNKLNSISLNVTCPHCNHKVTVKSVQSCPNCNKIITFTSR